MYYRSGVLQRRSTGSQDQTLARVFWPGQGGDEALDVLGTGAEGSTLMNKLIGVSYSGGEETA